MPRKLSFTNTPTDGSLPSVGSDSGTSTRLLKVAFRCCRHTVTGGSLLHQADVNVSLAEALLDRCPANLVQDFLLQRNLESGYTPLHSAISNRNFAMVLMLLRKATQDDPEKRRRFLSRPMALLAGSVGSGGSQGVLYSMVRAKDSEGFTPIQLLVKMQASDLARCRQALQNDFRAMAPKSTSRLSQSQMGYEDVTHQHGDDEEVLGVAFSELGPDLLLDTDSQERNQARCLQTLENYKYACEVITFGRAGHYGLGVAQQGVSSSNCFHNSLSRVKEFAYERAGCGGSAVAVAAATHHTLVVTQQGHLLAFGLSGKNGRLGLGHQIRECPLPRRVMGPLAKRRVMAVAAAENHSLCITRDEGWVFAWGSNRFGQLGTGNISEADKSMPNNCRWAPRRVEETMKHVACVAVAAGEKHSVALSRDGDVYAWGDNGCGQLGVPMGRTGSLQKPQKIPAMISKLVTRIAASEQSTLALARPASGMATNIVYQWGHGNHVPYKVSFERKCKDKPTIYSSRLANPVEIASAKYHSVAITADGRVYTWGLHAEPLGRSGPGSDRKSKQLARPRSSSFNRSISSPELVKGMLPENGGGIAVAVAASEEHTAVLTESGTLYTWGVAHGKQVLGHEGVKWQPSPKQVTGVHRAIQVSLAKEHTVLLVGASLGPPVQQIETGSGPGSLEQLAARKVAQHVDLFNVVPILTVAERIQCSFLIKYCSDFIRRNFDAVLNLAQKGVLEQYLEDVVAESLEHHGENFRDDPYHPFIMDLLTAGASPNLAALDRNGFVSHEEWLRGCERLARKPEVQTLMRLLSGIEEAHDPTQIRGIRTSPPYFGGETDACTITRPILTSNGLGVQAVQTMLPNNTHDGGVDRYIKKIANLDMSTLRNAEESLEWLLKEIRGIKKRLNQVLSLETARSTTLSIDQQVKKNRRPVLEAELHLYEDTATKVRASIEAMKREAAAKMDVSTTSTDETKSQKIGNQALVGGDSETADAWVESNRSFICKICTIKCPDKTSFELHKNGRKHRNKVAQVEVEGKKLAAAGIAASFQLEQIRSSTTRLAPVTPSPKQTAWDARNVKPRYKLPPPPHSVMAHIMKPGLATEKITSSGHMVPPLPTARTASRNIVKTQSQTPDVGASLTPGASKVSPLKSPVSGSAPSPTGLSNYLPKKLPPPATLTLRNAAAPKGGSERGGFSLADFLAPHAPTTQKSGNAPWASPRSPESNVGKSLREIQEEEAEFVSKKQDSAYGRGGGSWFIERRERANSLASIQDAAEKCRREQLFIEEQLRIEMQIKEELALEQKTPRSPRQNPKRRYRKGTDGAKNCPQTTIRGQKPKTDKDFATAKRSEEHLKRDSGSFSLLITKPTSSSRRPRARGKKKNHPKRKSEQVQSDNQAQT